MIYLIAGQKGTGKSLVTISLLNKKKKQYKYFFSNFPVNNFIPIHSQDWVNYRFPKGSAILIDEAQLYFNSREFNKLTKSGLGNELLDYLTMCRHYDVDIYFITQSANRIDLQIRELSDYVYHIKKTFKIPFTKRPFLVYGLEFFDIMEYEKYLNPNNFSTDCKARWLFKLIRSKDLKMYDTHYVAPEYFDKPEIKISSVWDVIDDHHKKSIVYKITNGIKKVLYVRYMSKKNKEKALKNIKEAEKFKDITI